MKRISALLLAFFLLISVFPVDANAVESQDDSIRDLAAYACTVFPEYADNINSSLSFHPAKARSQENISIAFQKTKSVSENRKLTYIELTNGEVLLADSKFTIEPDNTYTENGTGGIAVYTYDFDITRFASAGTFSLNSFRYRIYPNDNDCIVSKGTIETNYGCTASQIGYRQTESDSSPAYYALRLKFNIGSSDGSGGQFFQGDFSIYVEDNEMSYDILSYE